MSYEKPPVEICFNPFQSGKNYSIEDFCSIEVEGVREFAHNGELICEVDNETPSFFSAYLRFKPSNNINKIGVICIANSERFETIKQWAHELSIALGYHLDVRFDPSHSAAAA